MNDFIENLCKQINLSDEALRLALPYIDSGDARALADKILSHGAFFCSAEYKKAPCEYAPKLLAAALIMAERVYRSYRERDIPDSIYYDTMSDITVWVHTNKRITGIDGLANMGWLYNHLSFQLFKIGRMQYQFYKTNYIASGIPLSKIIKMPIKNHRRVLNMHIPEGGRLDLDACRESVERARVFFSQYFPDYRYDGFVCDSWLLDPRSRTFMSPDSNIVGFARLFDLVIKTKRDNLDIVPRLWGKIVKNPQEIKDFAENTSLQRQTKAYLLSGGKTGNGFGIIMR